MIRLALPRLEKHLTTCHRCTIATAFRANLPPNAIRQDTPNIMATEHQESKWEKDFSPFKQLFREIRLQINVELKVHKMKRTHFDEQFYEIFNELRCSSP